MTRLSRSLGRRETPAWRQVAVACAALLPLALLPTAVGAQEDDGDATATRVAGAERWQTAARIANESFDRAEVAVLATGEDFPDALAGSFAAGHLPGPVLLIGQDVVPEATMGMLSELGVTRVVLLGGTQAIGPEVEQALDEEGYSHSRVAGSDRYETAAEIALKYGKQEGGVGGPGGIRTAMMASGEDFPDALAAGPLSASVKMPLLLTPQDRTVPAVDYALQSLAIERILMIGGEAAVSSAIAAKYRDEGYTVERLAGPSRDATATSVANWAIENAAGFSERFVLLARGDAFPDALAGGIHGGVLGAPLLLTLDPNRLGGANEAWLGEYCPGIEVIRALGGESAVAQETLQSAIDAAEQCVRPNQEVARFQTPLPYNPDRTHNIHLAADYIDGDVIGVGESYSLNQGIGRRTQARGFREVENGCIGADGEAVDCVGGGVSQMGTTFMNVAWLTGVEIPEFRQHTIYFERYPICHEATLSWGSLDVVVHNNSPYDIVIDTFYTDEFIGVRYISREWAQVESWERPSSPPGSGSFDSSCGRTISYPEGSSDTEAYSWTYDDTGF